MGRYLIRRLLLLVPSMLVVFTITFFLMHATPGGPWARTGRPLPKAVIENLNARYGLDKPLWEQYTSFLVGIVTRGDFGPSYSRYGRDVKDILVDFFPVSLKLGAVAMVLALVLGLSLGVLSAVKHNTWMDYVSMFLGIVGVSVPSYVVATIMIIVFAITMRWVPTGGWDGILSRRILIPAIALSLRPMALLARYTRSSVLDVLRRDYVRTARAKGLPERLVLARHAVRNAMIPIATVAGITFANVVTGSFFVESVTKVPGIGRYFVSSVSARDYPVIMGTTLLYAAIVMVMNLIVDVVYVFLDPRVRYN